MTRLSLDRLERFFLLALPGDAESRSPESEGIKLYSTVMAQLM